MKKTAKIMAYYALHMNEYNMPLHSHDRFEIMYLVSGECTIFFENESQDLKHNQCIIIAPNFLHRLHIKQGTPSVLLNLEWEMGTDGIDLSQAYKKSEEFSQMWEEKFDYKIFYDRDKIVFATKDLINSLEAMPHDEFLTELTFTRFLLELSKAQNDSYYYSGIRYINRAKQYIESNLSEELDVNTIANYSGVSGYYLQSLFAKHVGQGVINYVNDLRINKACFLLKNSNLSVNDIAFEVGYNSRQHFAYTFEKREKMSPLAYRRLEGQSLQTDTKSMKKM